MFRIVCAVNDSLYYQILCKGLLQSLLKYRSNSWKLTVLLDGGQNAQTLRDLRSFIEILPVQPLNIVCGSVSSRTTFARLEIPDLFPEERRILYLDVDTFLMNSIDPHLSIPFSTLAAVVPGEHLMIKDFVRQEFKSEVKTMSYIVDGVQYFCGSHDHKYFNAGVMLMNPYQWLRRRIKEHVRALALTYPLAMHTSDEMALNLIFRGHFTQLPASYNTLTFTQNTLTEVPRIWHFNTCKPILQTSLNACQNWLSLFDERDRKLLRQLETISRTSGKNKLLAMKSDDYDHI